MAISYDVVDVNGVNKDVITVDAAAGTVIFKDSLDPQFDFFHLDAIQNSAGATFTAKLEAYTMPNGTTADVYYTDFIKVLADVADAHAEAAGVVPTTVAEFTATAAQTDYDVSHNGLVQAFVNGVETAATLTDRSVVVLPAATGGETVRIYVLSVGSAT